MKQAFADAVRKNAAGTLAVLSPFLSVEEAFLFATYFKGLSSDVKLVLGPVPIVGVDDKYPKDVKGNSVEPVKFTIRAEKCPNRRGVEAVLKHFQGSVLSFSESTSANVEAMWFAGGYPDPKAVDSACGEWKAPALVVVLDLFPTRISAAAEFVLPATSSFEKDATFVNYSGLAQTFARSIRPPREVRTELQLAYDLIGRKGLVNASLIRTELAKAIPGFAGLAEKNLPVSGLKFELAMA